MTHATHTGGLPSYAMRAILTALFGPQYVAPAARVLKVQEKRIKFWCDPDQDESPHASDCDIRERVERIFWADMADEELREDMLAEVNALADGVDFLTDLLGDTLYHPDGA